MKEVRIKNSVVGGDNPTYIIAEVGINHNGDLELAKDMILAAWENGADAVKIQTFVTEKFLHPSHPSYQHDIDAEISHKDEQQLWDFAAARKINLFSTPEEFSSLRFIAKQNPGLMKIASMDFNYKQLIQGAAALHKPIILSSGMSTLEETHRAVRWAQEAGNTDCMVLHCVSCYPTPPEACNLNVIQTLKTALGCPVGFSDHTIGTHIPFAAVCLGADIVEKHFTLDKKMGGPDQKISMSPDDLRNFVKNVRDFERSRGTGVKEPTPEEAQPRIFKRRGIYAKRTLKRGEILTPEDVVFFAPSTPLSRVTDWDKLVGRPLTREVKKMTPIGFEDTNA